LPIEKGIVASLGASNVEPNSTYNLHMDVQMDIFVAMETCNDDQAKSKILFVAKVIPMNNRVLYSGWRVPFLASESGSLLKCTN
jgi:hypothetical protein